METQKTSWRKLTREQRGQLIYKTLTITPTPRGWRVPSQTNSKRSYLVKFNGHRTYCDCPDCEIRKQKCKHIHAVEFFIKTKINEEGNVTEQKRGVKITYKQNWKAYDKAQTNEKLLFMRLLSDLCKHVKQPDYKFGRPTSSKQDLVFSSVMNVYTTFSLRRFMSDVKIAKEMGLIDKVPCFASVGHFMQNEEVIAILKELIHISALPLKDVETKFTIDSSGFSTCRFARYFDYKWGKESKYRIWLKAHLMSGVKTNIITGVEITDGYANDSPQLAPLIKGVSKEFNLQEVSCDRAYSSKKNLELIEDRGALPFIPFKKSTGTTHPFSIWGKMYHYFLYRHDEFLQHYHLRSNAESVFNMIKTKFRDSLRSKSKTAQVNELLCKVLSHNICVIIQEMNELGIKGEFVVVKEE